MSTETERSLSDGQKVAVVMAVAGMVAVGAYGLIISYVTVFELAVDLHMPLPSVFPLGIEGGLVAVLAMDLVLTWVRRPIAWLRQVARGLGLAAIGINAAAGLEHGPLAVVMHALAPIILITGVEALRHHLLRLVAEDDAHRREAIPRMRWVLAPLSSVAMWRRMVLWQVTRYSEALDTDLARRETVFMLRREFGRRWARQVPADVAYRLRTGVRLSEAITRAHHLIGQRHPVVVDDLATLGIADADEVVTVRLETVTGEPEPAAIEAAPVKPTMWPLQPTPEASVLPVLGACMAAHHRPVKTGAAASEAHRSKPTQPQRRTGARADKGRTVAPAARTTEDRARELHTLIESGDLTEDASVNLIRKSLRTSPKNAQAAIEWRAAHLTIVISDPEEVAA